MSARTTTERSRRAMAAITGLTLVVLAAVALHTQPAAAQTAAERAPMLTVTDATIERCGAVAITGTDFEPGALVTVSVNGTTQDDPPTADVTGSFTFTTGVECEQTSGFLKIQASDGVATVPIDVTIAATPAPLASGRAPGASDSSAGDGVAIWLVRLVLAGIVTAELVVLWRRQRERRARKARQQEAAAP